MVRDHVYRLTLRVANSDVRDISWVAGYIAGKYPATIRSVASTAVDEVVATVRWTGSGGDVSVGDTIGIPFAPTSLVTSPELSVVAIDDIGTENGAPRASNGLLVLLALGIIGGTAWAVSRIHV